jgi:hypothetical protein
MSPTVDPLDHALHELKAHRAVLSDSVSEQLQDRLLQEFRRRQGRLAHRRLFWIGAVIATLLAGTAASYAATKGWRIWPFSMRVDEEGVITNESGEVIGVSVDHEDGTSTSVIRIDDNGGHIEVKARESLKGKGLGLWIEKPDGTERNARAREPQAAKP